MPISSPFELSSAPPELPELIAASTCMVETERPKLPAFTPSRCKPETMPAVTEPPRPKGTGPPVVSLNCTHFGYARPLWEEAFAEVGFPGAIVHDPNPRMTDLVLREAGARRFPTTAVTVEVVSKTPITDEVRDALGALLRPTSPAAADALARWRHVPDLFHAEVDPSKVAR